MSWLTGYPDRNPYEPYSVGDPNAGVHALNALLLALEHRRRTGRGGARSRRRWSTPRSTSPPSKSSSTRPTVRCCSAPAIAGRRRRRKTCTAPTRSTSSAGATAGLPSRWQTDEQWAGLRDALGGPAWAIDPALASADGRRSHHDLIDEHLEAWCERRSGDDIVERAVAPPVSRSAKVMQPHRQSELPQLAARGFFEDVDHPVNATTPHSTLPSPFSAGPQSPRAARAAARAAQPRAAVRTRAAATRTSTNWRRRA